METIQTLSARIGEVRARIERAAARAGRPAAAITLIAVTKTMPAETVHAAALAGITDVGENRVQEASAKIAALGTGTQVHWHLIGHLQRNKVKRAAALFETIHSIDSLELAQALGDAAAAHGRTLHAFLQVNSSGEATKSGFAPEEVRRCAASLAGVPHLRWRGLMTIAPAGADSAALRSIFASTRELQRALAADFDPADWHALSMGMSDDFEIAIEEGATHVRVGRALFGERTLAAQG
jgi:PLP dependent protein